MSVRQGVGAVEAQGGRKPWQIEDGWWERTEPLPPVVERRWGIRGSSARRMIG